MCLTPGCSQGSGQRRGTGGCKQPAVWPGWGSPSRPRRLMRAGGAARAAAVPGARLGTGTPRSVKGRCTQQSLQAGPHRQRNIKPDFVAGEKMHFFLCWPLQRLSRGFGVGYQLLPVCGSLTCGHTQARSGPKKCHVLVFTIL